MKRKYKFLTTLSAVVVLLLVVSCNERHEPPVPGPDDPNAVHITAQMYDPDAEGSIDIPQTRTALDPDNNRGVTWVENDRIGIFKIESAAAPVQTSHYIYAYTADDPTAANPTSFSWQPTTQTLMWTDFTSDHTFYAYYPAGSGDDPLTSVSMPALANQNYFNVNALNPGYDPADNVAPYDFLYTYKTTANYASSSSGVNFKFRHASSLLEVRIGQTLEPDRKMTLKNFYISAKGLTINRSFDLTTGKASATADIMGTVGITYSADGQREVPYTTKADLSDIPAAGYFVVNPLKRGTVFSLEVLAEETVDGSTFEVLCQGTFELSDAMTAANKYVLRIDIEKRQAVVANLTVEPWKNKGTLEDPNVGFAPYIRKESPAVDPPVYDAAQSESTVKFTTNTSWKAEIADGVSWVVLSPVSGNSGTNIPVTVKCLANTGGVRVGTFKLITTQADATNREIVYTVTQRASYTTIADRFASGNICYDPITRGVKIGTPDETPIYFRWGSLVGLSGYSDGDSYDSGDVLYSPTGFDGAMPAWSNVPYISSNVASSLSVAVRDSLLVKEHVITAGKGDICRLVPGGRWRMATAADWQALIALSPPTLTLTDYYSTKGFWLGPKANTATADDPMGCVFIAAAGQRAAADGKTAGIGSTGWYYTGTPSGTNTTIVNLVGGAAVGVSSGVRTGAFPVRCIRE